jgi:hypothetical protein
MLVEAPVRPSHALVEEVVERHITERTSQRIRELRVEVTGDRVMVHGQASCYYVKQLAIQAVLEALEALDSLLRADVRIGVEAWGTTPRAGATGGSRGRLNR